jgi:hypothetical protein
LENTTGYNDLDHRDNFNFTSPFLRSFSMTQVETAPVIFGNLTASDEPQYVRPDMLIVARDSIYRAAHKSLTEALGDQLLGTRREIYGCLRSLFVTGNGYGFDNIRSLEDIRESLEPSIHRRVADNHSPWGITKMPHSEVCMSMRVAGEVMPFCVQRVGGSRQSAQLYSNQDYGFSSSILLGEAGIRHHLEPDEKIREQHRIAETSYLVDYLYYNQYPAILLCGSITKRVFARMCQFKKRQTSTKVLA